MDSLLAMQTTQKTIGAFKTPIVTQLLNQKDKIMITDYKNGILSFEQENEHEKIFCIVGTIKGDGENFARFITEKEIDKEGWYVPEQWSKDINNLEIGDSSTHGFWYYDKANIIIRVA